MEGIFHSNSFFFESPREEELLRYLRSTLLSETLLSSSVVSEETNEELFTPFFFEE